MAGKNIAANIADIKAKIGSVTLVAVSKFHSADKIREAFKAGITEFGENYVQEALEKMEQLADLNLKWHYTGSIQRNKIKFLVGKFSLIQSVDNIEKVKQIGNIATEKKITQDILIQVNIGEESSKSGIRISEVDTIVNQAKKISGVRVLGLMCLPPLDVPDEAKRRNFKSMKSKFDEIGNLKILSMGTSHDFEMAIAEGATMIRVGTDIFGERPKE